MSCYHDYKKTAGTATNSAFITTNPNPNPKEWHETTHCRSAAERMTLRTVAVFRLVYISTQPALVYSWVFVRSKMSCQITQTVLSIVTVITSLGGRRSLRTASTHWDQNPDNRGI